MKENKLKVSFFIQARRTDKKGLVPVIGRISVGSCLLYTSDAADE